MALNIVNNNALPFDRIKEIQTIRNLYNSLIVFTYNCLDVPQEMRVTLNQTQFQLLNTFKLYVNQVQNQTVKNELNKFIQNYSQLISLCTSNNISSKYNLLKNIANYLNSYLIYG